MADPKELNPNLKVKDLIWAFEQQREDQNNIYYDEDLYNKPTLKTSKSFIGTLPYKLFSESTSESYDIFDIENKLVKVENQINSYKIYDKEIHVAFQEQLFGILASIVDIDAQGDQNTIEKKKKLIKDIQILARHLNFKLPKNHNLRKVEPIVKQREPITGNEINDFNNPKKIKNSNAPIEFEKQKVHPFEVNVKEDFILPSVKKLKQLFSFNKTYEDLPKTNSTEISRSKSMLWKSKYTATKEIMTEATVSNQNQQNITSTAKEDSNYTSDNVVSSEVEFIDKNKENEQQTSESISVKQLRKLFEENKQENSQGLTVVFNTQPIIANDTGIAFTAMHLGAFRLKRSLSGQYMNHVGLVRKASLSSRSIPDLTSFDEKDPLIIDKLGNIENEIYENEEETMPSLDYNGGFPSLEATHFQTDQKALLPLQTDQVNESSELNSENSSPKEDDLKTTVKGKDDVEDENSDYNLEKIELKTNIHFTDDDKTNKMTTELLSPEEDDSKTTVTGNEVIEDEKSCKNEYNHDKIELESNKHVTDDVEKNKLDAELFSPEEDYLKPTILDKELIEVKEIYNSECNHDKVELGSNRHVTENNKKNELTIELTKEETTVVERRVIEEGTTVIDKEDIEHKNIYNSEYNPDIVELERNRHVTHNEKKNSENAAANKTTTKLEISQPQLEINGKNLSKLMNNDLFSDPDLDIENIDEEFEKLLSETNKE